MRNNELCSTRFGRIMRMAGKNSNKEHADITPTPDLSHSEDQKVILIAYLTEAMHRVHRPLDLTRMNLQIIADQVKTGEFEPEEIRMELQIQINNIGKMIQTLEELNESVTKGHYSIPEQYKEFLK
jgi:hypothetical protein